MLSMRTRWKYYAMIIGVLLVGGGMWVGYTVYLPRAFPVRVVKIYSNDRVDRHALKVMLSPFLQKGFFSIPLSVVRDQLLQEPWVATVTVRRIWPDQLHIFFIKKVIIAQWNKESFLSDTGTIYAVSPTTPANDPRFLQLPQFEGPEDQQTVMLDYFNQMNRLLTPLHVKIIHLVLSPYHDWKVKLDNGMTLVLGHKDCLARMDRFVRVYPKIIHNGVMIESVDLRYPHGLAVRWKNNNGKETNAQ